MNARSVAVVGATGAVGREFERLWRQRRLSRPQWRLFASPASSGASLDWCGEPASVDSLHAGCFQGVELAFFSAGAAVSREWVPQALESGARVVDNSSAFRMLSHVPLIVPEINADDLRPDSRLVSVPNCAAIILTMVLAPLHRRWPLRRVDVATYQAVSGAGALAVQELLEQSRDVLAGRPAQPRVLPEPCAFNVFSHNSPVGEDGLNAEERKIIDETRRILVAPKLVLGVACMRVPVVRAHLEAVTLEFDRPIDLAAVRSVLAAAPGLRIVDDGDRFPSSLRAAEQDEVHVGRIRLHPGLENRGVQLLCAGDQLRKGAALNALQIAEIWA